MYVILNAAKVVFHLESTRLNSEVESDAKGLVSFRFARLFGRRIVLAPALSLLLRTEKSN